MDDAAFEQAFKIKRAPTLTAEQKQRAGDVNRLFDEMEDRLNMRSGEIFAAAGADHLHSAFLHNVADCPEFVVRFCQERLARPAPTPLSPTKNI